MPSVRAHIVSFLTRHITKKQLSRCKTPEDVRRVFDAARTFPVKGVTYTPATLGGVPGEWAQDPTTSPRANLLYLHGGGYVGMSPVTHRPITGAFAKRGFRVFAPDYRLAPEHPFPAALDDATAAWLALRASVEGPCYVAGDSAGGGLSLALLLNLKGLNERNADAACLFSPWTDLAATGDSMRSNALRDPLLVSEGIETIAGAYAGAAGTAHPLVSPLYGEFAGLPPLIFYVGESEILRDDTLRAAEKARAAGVTTQAHVFDGVPHVWQFMSRILPEGRRSMDEAAAFLLAAKSA